MKFGFFVVFGKYENIIIYEDFLGVLGSMELRKKLLYGIREYVWNSMGRKKMLRMGG